MREAEEFWEELLAQIEAEQVIPVVGPELLTVVVEGREAPLYEDLAECLLAKYGLVAAIAGPEGDSATNGAAVPLRPYHELNDAVCALAQRGRRVQDLYRPINDLLKALLESCAQTALQPLRDLAVPSNSGCSSPLPRTTCWLAPSTPSATVACRKPSTSSSRPNWPVAP